MFTLTPTSKLVRHLSIVRLFGMFLALGLMTLLFSITTSHAFAAPRLPESTQLSQPTMLGLADFSVKVTRTKVAIARWETGSESLILGFNLWKRTAKGEWVKQNADLIPAVSTGQVIGNAYTFRDKQVKSGKTYHYQLEVVATDGTSAFTDIAQVRVP